MMRMDDIMDCLSGENYFTKIDLNNGYHHIKIKEGDEWKTVLKTFCMNDWLCLFT